MRTTEMKVRHDLKIHGFKEDHAYVVPSLAWRHIREDLKQLTPEPWVNQTFGSLFVGAGLATLISIVTGTIQTSTSGLDSVVITWVVCITCFFVGGVFLSCAQSERSILRSKAGDIEKQMDRVEQMHEVRDAMQHASRNDDI